VRAAIWPDWVKQPTSIANRKTRSEITRNFSHGAWHFVNKPIRHFDGTTEAEREAIEANIANPKKKRGEIMEKLPKLIAGLKGEGNVNLPELVWGGDPNEVGVNEGQARAIALCWVLHLVGDIHQPLHAATLFSKDSPDGDQGGNNFIVRLENHATNLHAIWDGEFGWDKLKGPNDSQFAVVDGLAHDLVARIRPTTVQREEMRLEKWADESFRLAESKAYFSSTQQLLPGEILRPQEHRPHASELDPLPAGYAGLVKKTAEQRVTLAGYRMGTLLGDLV
ncbi:MAG: hypothetical protein J0I06_19760, partial [Planctomycetes bacterium]|nr:hypothetical protein [Planctomycetota bacterium]